MGMLLDRLACHCSKGCRMFHSHSVLDLLHPWFPAENLSWAAPIASYIFNRFTIVLLHVAPLALRCAYYVALIISCKSIHSFPYFVSKGGPGSFCLA